MRGRKPQLHCFRSRSILCSGTVSRPETLGKLEHPNFNVTAATQLDLKQFTSLCPGKKTTLMVLC